MKIGYRTAAFADRPVTEALQAIAEAGYNSVELCLESDGLNPLELTPAKITELRAQLDDLGLSVAAVSYQGLEDQLEVRRQRRYAAIDLLPQFGAPVFVVASRREEPARLHVQWDEALQLYSELGNLCAERDCILAVEPNPGLVIRNTEDLVRALRELDHPNVGATLDVAHAAVTGDDLPWSIYQLGGRLRHLHIADIRDGVHDHLVPGTGQIDFHTLHETLDSVGYNGPAVLDMNPGPGDPAAICREALVGFRQVWSD